MKTNAFIDAVGFKPTTTTENGAVTLTTSSSAIVDQFGKAGNFRGRTLAEVFAEQAQIWNENAEAALRFPFYLRMVTRKVKVNADNETDKVQSGQGARDESFKRLLWIALEHQEAFYNNIWALPLVGSWKDLWTLMFYDIKENTNCINQKAIFEVIAQGLLCDTHIDLIKKYMPRIKSQSKCKTDWTKITNNLAKAFASQMGISYKEYNKMKASGKAHDFQKLICSRNYKDLNWNHIPGRALNLLVSSKFLSNHNLKDNYTEWILQQPVAKFTGYVFELAKRLREARGSRYGYARGRGVNIPVELKHTLDAQFKGLVDKARDGGKITENVWCCLDTSGSMNQAVRGLKDVYCSDIASSLALFFADLNTGPFHNKVIMFDNVSTPHDMKGESFCDRIMNLPSVGYGGTNFQSAVDEIIKIRKAHPEIPLEQWPTTILAVSDMEFNPSGGWISRRSEPTNYEYSVSKLKEVFPEEFVDNMKFIWWDCVARHGVNHFEGDAFTSGCTFLSGWDGSIITKLFGEESRVIDEETGKVRNLTAEELVAKALNQEILSYINV